MGGRSAYNKNRGNRKGQLLNADAPAPRPDGMLYDLMDKLGAPYLIWLQEVNNVLNKPGVAIALFIMGVLFIVLASKQVKAAVHLLEKAGVTLRLGEGVLGNMMTVFVFLFVWMDVIILTAFKAKLVETYKRHLKKTVWKYFKTQDKGKSNTSSRKKMNKRYDV